MLSTSPAGSLQFRHLPTCRAVLIRLNSPPLTATAKPRHILHFGYRFFPATHWLGTRSAHTRHTLSRMRSRRHPPQPSHPMVPRPTPRSRCTPPHWQLLHHMPAAVLASCHPRCGTPGGHSKPRHMYARRTSNACCAKRRFGTVLAHSQLLTLRTPPRASSISVAFRSHV